MKEVILCVDDEVIILQSLKLELMDVFGSDVLIESTSNALEALEILDELIADGYEIAVLITDQKMPHLNGSELIEKIHKKLPECVNIMLTGFSDIEALREAVNRGSLFRFISKPWLKEDLFMIVKEALAVYRDKKLIRQQKEDLEKLAFALLAALESAAAYYDPVTGEHMHRVGLYSSRLAQCLGYSAVFSQKMQLYSALHDVGKLGLDADVLKKTEKYTPEDFAGMKRHVAIGWSFLKRDDIDPMIKNIVRYHHEHWDGSGYLEGISGESIPVEARVVSVIDAFDALLTEKPYKQAYSKQEALSVLKNESGKQFDPHIVNVFIENLDFVWDF